MKSLEFYYIFLLNGLISGDIAPPLNILKMENHSRLKWRWHSCCWSIIILDPKVRFMCSSGETLVGRNGLAPSQQLPGQQLLARGTSFCGEIGSSPLSLLSDIGVGSPAGYPRGIAFFKTLQDRQRNRLVVAKREAVGGKVAWELGVSRCKLWYIEWKSSKVLSTGNCIQYPVINYNEKEYENRMCIWIILLYSRN